MTPSDAVEPVFPAASVARLTTPARASWSTLQVLGAIAACLLGLGIVYRVQIASGGTVFASDPLDGRIAVVLEEHWFNVFRGLEPWNEPLYFAPAPDTLGYNDGYLLYGMFFSLFRAAGCDGILAGELSGAVFRIIGFVGMVLFAAGPCRFRVRWAVLAALLAMVGNAGYLQAAHVQLTTVGLAPLLGWLVWQSGRGLLPGRSGAVAWSCAAAVLAGAWLLTAIYTIWFTAIFAAMMGMAALITEPKSCLDAIRRYRLARLGPALLILAAGFALFIRVYLPKAHETGMHPYRDAMRYAPALADLVHIGPQNLLFGWLDVALTALFRPGFNEFEHLVGFAPVLLCLAVAGVVWGVARPGGATWRRPLAMAFVACLVLCLRVGDHSLWWFVFTFVPGAPAVRVVARFYLLLGLVAALLATDTLTRVARRLPAQWLWLLPGLAVLLVAEEVNTGGLFDLNRDEEAAFVAAIPPPPSTCSAFYITQPRPVIRDDWRDPSYNSLLLNIDAMVLAERLHLPTLNGHASFLPRGFRLGYHDQARYTSVSHATIIDLGMAGQTCGLSLTPPAWSTNPLGLAPLAWDHEVSFGAGGEFDTYGLHGWYPAEPHGRWTEGGAADLGMVVPAGAAVRVEIQAAPFAPPGHASSPVALYANGTRVAEWSLPPGEQTITATVPADVVGPLRVLGLRFAISAPASPRRLGLGTDPRQLGLFVEWLRLSPADESNISLSGISQADKVAR